jgi:WD40 repeat protein
VFGPIDFSPDEKMVATGTPDKTIELWSLETARELGTLGGNTAWISCPAFSPDGTRLASGSRDMVLKLCDGHLHHE